jgi:hypothetical protein
MLESLKQTPPGTLGASHRKKKMQRAFGSMKLHEMICNRRPLAHGRPMEHYNITTAQFSSAPKKINFYFLVTRRDSQSLHLGRHTHRRRASHPPSLPSTQSRHTPQSAPLRMHARAPSAQRPAHLHPVTTRKRPQAKHARPSRGRTAYRAVPRPVEGDRVGGARLVSHPVE